MKKVKIKRKKHRRSQGLLFFFILSLFSFLLACSRNAPPPASPVAPLPPAADAGGTAGMVRIPGGTFMMGCVEGDAQCAPDEKPAHRVTVNPFWMDEHPVTAAEYAPCVRAKVCPPEKVSDDATWGRFYNGGKPDRANHPLNGMDWGVADDYCRWRGKRLPTEAEYEFAMRGGSAGNKYPWGNSETPPPGFGNYADESVKRLFADWKVFAGYDDGYAGTSPVCTFAKNPYGLCDISGNLWEWCADWYDPNYYQSSPSDNPKGPETGTERVLRGGSWDTNPARDRSSCRAGPGYWVIYVGFRCARD
jgi:formylglycine-generating enzyme required for sulfatase activity